MQQGRPLPSHTAVDTLERPGICLHVLGDPEVLIAFQVDVHDTCHAGEKLSPGPGLLITV